MNLFEKLNRLDDSLVESKRVIKKKKLTESIDKATWSKIKKFADNPETTGLDFAYSGPYADEVAVLYGETIEEYNQDSDVTIEPSASVQAGRGSSEIYSDDGGYAYMDFETECDELLELARESDSVEEFKKGLLGHIYSFVELLEYEEDEEDYDDDIDEMLTEAELTPWEKIAKTFPDLDIRLGEGYLKEAVKDTDYVIAYVHPVSTFSKRYSFLGSNYRMTKDLDKAMTYTSKFSAEYEVKYAKDEVERIVDSSTSTGYASNFAADSDRFLVVTVAQARELLKNPDKKVSRAVSNNAEAQKAAKPVATEIHSIIKKYNVSLSSFLMLIKELIKAEDPEA